MLDTWEKDGYDLLPKLRTLNIPTIVLVGDRDLVPTDIAAHIAQAIPNAQLVTLKNCGHFACQCAGDVARRCRGIFLARRRADGRNDETGLGTTIFFSSTRMQRHAALRWLRLPARLSTAQPPEPASWSPAAARES